MRGLIAAVLLAPALASALVVPNTWDGDHKNDAVKAHESSQPHKLFNIVIPIPRPQTHNRPLHLSYRLGVGLDPSGPECGSGNIILNSDFVPYKQGEDLKGEHTLTPSLNDEQISIQTKWEITCGQPQPAIENSVPPLVHSVNVFVDEVNSQPVTKVGVTIRYTQVDGQIEILDGTSFDDNPGSAPHDLTSEEVRIGEMQKQLRILMYQNRDLKRLIREQKAMIAQETRMSYGDAGAGVLHCNSVKCVFKVALHDCKQAVKHAKHKVTSAFGGHGRHGKHGKGGCPHPPPPHGHHPPPPPHWKPASQPYRLRTHHVPPPQGRPIHGPPSDGARHHRLPPSDRPHSDEPHPDLPNIVHAWPSPSGRRPHIGSEERHSLSWYEFRHPYILISFLLLLTSVLLRIYIKLHRRAARLNDSTDTSSCKRRFRRHGFFRCCRKKAQQKLQAEREYSEKDGVLPIHEPQPLHSDVSHITAEIGQLRTAAEFVDEMVSRASSEEERGPAYARRSSTSTMATLPEYRERDADCKVPEEELPVYEIGDGSDEGRSVADGLCYVPSLAEVWRARLDGVDVKV